MPSATAQLAARRMLRRFGMGLLLVLLVAPASSTGRVHRHLEVLLSGEDAIYTELLESFRSWLGDLDATEMTLSISLADEVAESGGGGNPDLLIAVGSRAAQVAAQNAGTRPVLAVLAPRSALEPLRGRTGARFSAIYLDQPPGRLMALGRAALPRARRAGMLAGPDLQPGPEAFRRMAEVQGFSLNIQAFAAGDNPTSRIRRILDESEVVLAPYDPLVFGTATAKWLLYMAYQRGLPVIGFSRSYVRAGALAAVYSTPEQIGRQTAEVVRKWLREDARALPAAVYPAYYNVEVNDSVARTLGIDAPDPQVLAGQVARLSGGVR
ncbi:MAG: ABC transporter substrate binding protein [Gammaproteobacteria bacterium]|nr:ABC transporter substrate binding protein [Gammaproteobacteria bacterium]